MKIDSENLFIPEAFRQKIMNVMDAVLACLLVFYVISNGHLSEALAPIALMVVTHTLTDRNWRLAISHVCQFSHHPSRIVSSGNGLSGH